jgi:hypothetical protein
MGTQAAGKAICIGNMTFELTRRAVFDDEAQMMLAIFACERG